MLPLNFIDAELRSLVNQHRKLPTDTVLMRRRIRQWMIGYTERRGDWPQKAISMTSEERKQKRYEKRRKEREEKAKAVCAKTFEDVFDFDNMWDAGANCCSGVRWKTSTINFETMLLAFQDY